MKARRFAPALALLALTACGEVRVPMFMVGDCLVIDHQAERWQKPVVMRVEERGRAAYLVRFWLDARGWALEPSYTVRFDEAWMYSRTPCPDVR